MERELLLLGLLRRQDMHGYQLHEYINNNLASCTDLKKPTAYHLLERMEQRGWLEGIAHDDPDSNRPARRVYHLTEQGERAFQEMLRENLATWLPATFGGDIGIAFLDALPEGEAFPLLEKRRKALTVQLDLMAHVPLHQGSMALVIEHQIHHLQSELDWLNQLLTRMTQTT
jgi:DNA-binding PadR family transcriptional regulator